MSPRPSLRQTYLSPVHAILTLLLACAALALWGATWVSVAHAEALAGTYPLTAYQWHLCETKVTPIRNGQASPCTDASVDVAYRNGEITKAEHSEWYRSKAAAAAGREKTYSSPPDGTPTAFTTQGSATGGLPTIGSGNTGATSPTPTTPGTGTAGGAPTGASAGSYIASSGSSDYLSGLGLTSPFCGGGGLSASQVRDCSDTGSPWTNYPVSNYGLDINTGSNGGGILSLNVTGFVTGLLQELANGLWMFGLYLLEAVITLVELAFGLNLFGNNQALTGISGALSNLYNNFDVPWFGAVLAAIGLWGIWTGLIQRKHSYTIGATLSSVLMIVLAMWIIAKPADTVGAAYQAANEASLDLIAAPSQGTVANPQGSFATAMASLWNQMVRGPWCALNFTSITFCEGAPEQQAVHKAAKDAYRDNSILLPDLAQALSASGGNCAAAAIKVETCIQHYVETHQPYGPPATRADLYLRYSPGSQPRSDLWTYYHGTDDSHILIFDVGGGQAGKNPAAVAIQGSDGWITRIGLLLLLGCGLLGALLMLVWIAVRLLLQTCMGLLLLFLTPITLIFPAFGENGRAMFATWGKSLLGAMIGKAFYAAMLAAAVTGSSAISLLAGHGASFGIAFLLLASFWWAIFLKRNEVLALVQAGPRNALADPERGHVAARAAAGYATVMAARYGIRQHAESRTGRRQQKELSQRAERQGGREAAYQELSTLEQDKSLNEVAPAKRDLAERDGLQTSSKNNQKALAQLEDGARARQEQRRLSGQPEGQLYTAGERQKRKALIDKQRGIEAHLADNQGRYARAEQALKREDRKALGDTPIDHRETDRRIERLRHSDRNPTSDQNLRSYAGITAAQYDRSSPAEQTALQSSIAAQMVREDALLGAVPAPERGGIEHAPTDPREAAAREILGREQLGAARTHVASQMEERLRDREGERGPNRGVIRRRLGRSKQAAKLERIEVRQQAWADRDAQVLSRTRERLDAARRRGRGRP